MSTSRAKKRTRTAKSTKEFITIRQAQLWEDRNRAQNPHDQLWYDRLIDELEYVKQYDQNQSLLKGRVQ